MADQPIRLTPPLTDEVVEKLNIGDKVLITGVIYTGRDAAHKRMVQALDEGKELPFDIKGQIIYFAGPTPTRPGNVTGSIGPTTSYRMDSYSPRLIEKGLKGMIGKGSRAKEVVEAMKKHKSIYFGATGGGGAVIARAVTKLEVIAYEELGPEAIRRLEVKDFPAVVVNDVNGNDLYRDGARQYERS